MKYPWIHIAQQLQSIAQEGLTYTEGPFDRIRYTRLRELAVQIMADFSDTDMETVKELFASGTRYPTPKVDIRAVVIREDKILLVKEEDNDLWSLPGGWAEVGLTPTENAVKEVREESGYEVEAVRLLAVWDKKCYPHPPEPDYAYKFAILCKVVGGSRQISIETTEVDWFGIDELPPLSTNRNTESQIRAAFSAAKKGHSATVD